MLARIGGFFGTLFGAFALFGGLTWMQKNGEAIKTVFKVVASLVKFVFKITSFGIGQVFNGMVRMFGTGVLVKIRYREYSDSLQVVCNS